jgi:predicted ribosomally synthesized peptide with nif11-like leader
MSIEKAKEYLIHLTENDEAARKAEDANVKALLDLSSELGYDIEEADLRQAVDELSGLGELTEEDMEAIAGGAFSSGFYLRRPPLLW